MTQSADVQQETPPPSSRSDLNWVGVLEHHARRTTDKALSIFDGTTLTYRGMLDRTVRLAAGLRQHGVRRGDVVALLSYNNSEFLITMFASNYLGAAVMPLNWRLAAPELKFILEHSRAVALVCDGDLVELANAATGGLRLARVSVSTDQGGPDWMSFQDLGQGSSTPPREHAQGDDLHRLMYTSGTTGRPKGVMITYANLAWKNHAHIVEFGLTNADIGLACGPLYHVGALDLTTTSLIAVGGTTLVHRTFEAERVVDEIERSHITTLWMAPSMVRSVLDVPKVETRDLSSVRLIIGGGEKMPIPLIDRLQRVFPSAWFADAYGLTETVSGDTFLDRASIRTKLGSVGRPCQYLELDIWDDQGVSLPPGERGEVVLRGPKVFKGYWRDPESTSAAFRGGWFHTGDVGVRDDDGYLFIVDRLKDMIVSGGENIASSEIERVLYEHDAVHDAAVIARPDERWGEVPVAFVVVSDGSATTADDLLDHCRTQLARFKVPRAVVLVDALPRNPSGKVLKRELRAWS